MYMYFSKQQGNPVGVAFINNALTTQQFLKGTDS